MNNLPEKWKVHKGKFKGNSRHGRLPKKKKTPPNKPKQTPNQHT